MHLPTLWAAVHCCYTRSDPDLMAQPSCNTDLMAQPSCNTDLMAQPSCNTRATHACRPCPDTP